MKKYFLFYFTALFSYECVSMDYFKEDELLKTHKMVTEKNGDKIFFPNKYDSYKVFKEKYVENEYVKELLANRLCILKELVENNNNKNLYLESLLTRNQIAIISSSKKDEFNTNIFNIQYDNTSNIKKHAIQIYEILKKRLNEEEIKKLDNLFNNSILSSNK